MVRRIFLLWLFVSILLSGCEITQRCYQDKDCPGNQICSAEGECSWRCTWNGECAEGFECVDHSCMPTATQPLNCPEDMVSISDTFCIDKWEASRPDATESSSGVDESYAANRPGVLPWRVDSDNAAAEAACEAAGKRLCAPAEWTLACRGVGDTQYGYGDDYESETCNGIDLFGRSNFHLLPTGSLESCTNGWGVYDLNGNLWEHTAGGSSQTVRGGAYNCSDSAALHRCEYIPRNWTPSALGFRCCSDGDREVEPLDPAPDSDDIAEMELEDGSDAECLEEDFGDLSDVFDLGQDTDTEADFVSDGDTADEEVQDQVEDQSGSKSCPLEMVLIDGLEIPAFCLDRYEASHADATSTEQGSSPIAASLEGVMPWYPVNLEMARAACDAAGKRLCALDEWVGACHGTSPTNYTYGDDYEPAICNGIDTFCDCSQPACSSAPVCPYPHCRQSCGAYFHATPTGSFPACHNEWGAYDINGNVWELADSDDGLEHFRGGAYNCSDSEALHRCDHDGTWGPSARGFRCCGDPLIEQGSGSPPKQGRRGTPPAPPLAPLESSGEGAVVAPRASSHAQVYPPGYFERPHDLEAPLPLGAPLWGASRASGMGLRARPPLRAAGYPAAPGFSVGADARPEPEASVDGERCQDLSCLLTQAAILRQDDPKEALRFLKGYKSSFGEEEDFVIALAQSYFAAGNHFWAIKTLNAWLSLHPGSCAVATWLSFIQLQQANLPEAQQALAAMKCDPASPAATRALLVQSILRLASSDPEGARDALEQARGQATLYQADREALETLSRSILADERPEFRWQLELRGGYTSNALLGSPNDPVLAGKEGATPLFAEDLWIAISPYPGFDLRPVLELQVRGSLLTAEDVSELSNLSLVARPGFAMDWGTPALALFYRAESLLLSQGDRYEDGPLWYYQAHRGEFEIDPGAQLSIFGGVGRRVFREAVRTRTEIDGGVGGAISLFGQLSALWALTGRRHFASSSAYDLAGVTGLTHLIYQLPLDLQARAGLSLAADWYLHSEGYFDDEARDDLNLQLNAAFWSPNLWDFFRAGLQFRWADRMSSIARYDFQDTRIMLALRFGGQQILTGPRAVGVDAPPLPWQLEDSKSNTTERIQDLLRRDEEVQRSSSCVQ